jgi:protein TonB
LLLLAPVAAVAWWSWQNDWPVENTSANPAPAETQAPAVPARSNLASFVSNDDYPTQAIRNEEQGTSAFVLTVNRRGRVTDCAITSSSGSTSLDRATCSIMTRRARFTPAKDDNGQAIATTVHSRIRWVIPEE